MPGMYSLTASSPEEQLAVSALLEEGHAAVVCVVDATTFSGASTSRCSSSSPACRSSLRST